MDKKRDKFAKLRSKKCSKINVDVPQITNFFNPKISSSVSGTIGCEVLSQHQQSQERKEDGVENEPNAFIELDDDASSKDSASSGSRFGRQYKAEENAKKRIRKRGKSTERKGPKSKTKKVDDDRFLNEMLVYQSFAENVNPDDLQLALALSRSMTETEGKCSRATTEDDNSNTSQSSKSTAKFTLEEYGFKSTAQYNRSVILGMEKELKGFRKMSPLLHRNPKKQERLFNEKINELLEKSIYEQEYRRKRTSSYHFLVTSENLLKWLNTGDGIMAMSSNPDPSTEIYSCYYTGNLMPPSTVKITSMLRDWDAIPGRERPPDRASKMELEEQSPRDSEGLGFEPSRRSITPDILRSDEDSTMKNDISIEISSDEEIPETPEPPMDSLAASPVKLEEESSSNLRKTESKSFLEVEDKMLEEAVIVIDSDEEEEINQSINKILEDHQETRQFSKSVSDGFILDQNRRSQLADEFDLLELTPLTLENIPPSSQININSLLEDDIILEEPEKISQKDTQEVTFISQSMRNQDICVVKRRGVTPPPDYDAMDEEDIQEELKKYGLKAIKGRKAKTLLEHIYNQLHPFIQVQDEMYDLKCKYGLIDAEKDHKESKEMAGVAEHVDIVCKDDFLGDVEGKKCILPCPPRRKLPTCALPLHIAFYNLLQSNKDLHEKILQYQPISLEIIQEHFKNLGVKYESNDLIEFLDKTCITFQGPNSGSRTRRKASPRKCSAKLKSANNCGE